MSFRHKKGTKNISIKNTAASIVINIQKIDYDNRTVLTLHTSCKLQIAFIAFAILLITNNYINGQTC